MYLILFKYFFIPVAILLHVLVAVAVYNYRDKDGFDIIGVKDVEDEEED